DLVIRYGVNVVFVAAELADGDGYLDRITEAANEMGGIGGMLFPVGANVSLDDCTFDPERVAWITRVNYEAVVSAVTRFLPELTTRSQSTIVAFGSVAAVRGRGRNVAYSAAKRALQTFFESLRHTCSQSRVNVQFYVLGYMDTGLARNLRSLTRKGDAHALCRKVLRNLHRDIGVVYYPSFWAVLSIVIRRMPWWIFKRMSF